MSVGSKGGCQLSLFFLVGVSPEGCIDPLRPGSTHHRPVPGLPVPLCGCALQMGAQNMAFRFLSGEQGCMFVACVEVCVRRFTAAEGPHSLTMGSDAHSLTLPNDWWRTAAPSVGPLDLLDMELVFWHLSPEWFAELRSTPVLSVEVRTATGPAVGQTAATSRREPPVNVSSLSTAGEVTIVYADVDRCVCVRACGWGPGLPRRGRGSGTQKFVYQKKPKSIFLFVNFLFSHLKSGGAAP